MIDDFSRFIEELKERANIIDVVSWYSQVVKKGATYWACCPLHQEKTPSFCIYEKTKTYYCYGCHAAGDVIKLVQEMEHLDFMGAVEFLASRFNMEVPEFSKKSNNAVSLKKHKEELTALMRATAIYYNQNLRLSNGKVGLDYLHSRGLDDNTITTFGMGYSLGYEDLPKYLASKGFKYKDMVETNVVIKHDNKDSYFDPLANRVIVPIINAFGNVIALGGRIIEKKENTGKYRNSAETILFHKSKEIFGANLVKKIRPLESIIVVEGYMDVIALYQAGIKNVVATMGTALTQDQAKAVKRLVNKVYLCYDGDNAGQEHIYKGVDILYSEGLDVYAVLLPENLDPDEYIRKYGKDKYLDIVKKSQDIFTYKINTLAKKYNLSDANEKGNFAIEALKALKIIRSIAQLDPYLTLITSMTQIDKQILLEQFKNIESEEKIVTKYISNTNKEDSAYMKAIRFIIYVLCGGFENLKVKDEFFESRKNDELLDIYNLYRQSNGALTVEDLADMADENKEANQILIEGRKVDENNAKKYFEDCRRKVLLEDSDDKINTIRAQLVDSSISEERRLELETKLLQITDFRKKLRNGG